MKYVGLIEKLGLSREETNKLSSYMEGILEWNEKINLTAITGPEEFIEKHYADSLSLLPFSEFDEAKKIIDVGTGGGFPGVPLAIASKDKDFILMDSLAKRLKVIDELLNRIEVGNARTLHGRAEDLARDPEYREAFDLCVSRAVADMSVLAEYTLPFVKIGGAVAAYKSEDIEEELSGAENAIRKLGGEILRTESTGPNRQIVIIKKTAKTPRTYPRKAGTPKKEPIK